MKPLRRTHCVLASLASVSRDRVESDWMHDTARCLGYPSYSSRTARKQGRDAAHGPSPAHSSCAASPTPTRDDVTSVTGSALHAAGGAARHGQSGPGGPGTDTSATGSAPRAAGGAPASASQARAGRGLTPPPPVRPPRAAGGATRVGPVRPAGSGHPPRHRSGPPARPAVLSPLTTTWLSPAPPAWGYGPWGRAYHHAASAGPECCVHRIASSGRLRRPRVAGPDAVRLPLSESPWASGPTKPGGRRADSLSVGPRARAAACGPSLDGCRPCSPPQVGCHRWRKPGYCCSTRMARAGRSPDGRTRTGTAERAWTLGRLVSAATSPSASGLARVRRRTFRQCRVRGPRDPYNPALGVNPSF